MKVDPVCGMSVKTHKTALWSNYRGQKYYFCTLSCQKAFDAHPEKYAPARFSRSGDETDEHRAFG